MRATTGTRQARVPRWLGDAPSDKVFYCCSGEVYRNVRELEAGLAQMAEDYFVYHVNSEKNDFSKWIQDVIADGYLAGRLAGCQNRAQALQAVRERLGDAGMLASDLLPELPQVIKVLKGTGAG